ncbi:MAG: phenylacetate-CoA oxygenase subunit PaaJ [Armatimonadetes bacterium]|nr:MAG: phenylacetate-CoA oxygenase subunit PaaJ [Armatimonadota bacterium]
MKATLPTVEEVKRLLDAVVDPEIPVMTIADMGILRDVTVSDTGAVTVGMTPTYSGCPALTVIEEDIVAELKGAGIEDVTVEVRHFPAWTTEWLTPEGKKKLAGFGIAPPDSVLAIVPEVLCPQCSSSGTAKVSEFGSTACKSLWVCTSCGEPFDYFKAI